jgi:hypothetical protein
MLVVSKDVAHGVHGRQLFLAVQTQGLRLHARSFLVDFIVIACS